MTSSSVARLWLSGLKSKACDSPGTEARSLACSEVSRLVELGLRLLAKPATVSFEMLSTPVGGMLHAIEVKLPAMICESPSMDTGRW